ncbi:hypothetical protein HUJ05_007703 [Dendroctonus ponderosae]|nr:hypothetical protein HUJ05_007703 [Dendroctonus ponderosae]
MIVGPETSEQTQDTIDGVDTPHTKRTKPALRHRPTLQTKALTRSEIAEKYDQLLDKRLEVADLQKKKLEEELLTIEEPRKIIIYKLTSKVAN